MLINHGNVKEDKRHVIESPHGKALQVLALEYKKARHIIAVSPKKQS